MMKTKKRKIFFYGIVGMILLTFGYTKYQNMNINDIGLAVLGWVKKVRGKSVNLNKLNTPTMKTINHTDWTKLLQRHVTKEGKVDYKGLQSDNSLLQSYLTKLSKHPPGDNWSDEDKLAYWINAYNAYTVKLILDNYPLNSIKEIGDGLPMVNSPWDIKFFKIGGVDFDLNTIEHEILRKQFNEPRIHFAINCASFSCPKLRNEAFEADALEHQLEEQASDFINNTSKNRISETESRLSKIFDWFQSDFTKLTTLTEYIRQYNSKISDNTEIKYLEYNWELNN